MDRDKIEQNSSTLQPVGVSTPATDKQNPHERTTFMSIQHVTAWVMILSAILFAIIGLLAVWQVIGPDTGDIIWRSLSSLAIIAFAALIVNVAARTVDQRK